MQVWTRVSGNTAPIASGKAGKPAKVAIVACMRKLTILNAILRDKEPWQPA